MTAALSYKAIKSIYLGGLSFWCIYTALLHDMYFLYTLDNGFWTIYNLKSYILFKKHLFGNYHVLCMGLDIGYKQMYPTILALKQLTFLMWVRIFEHILENILVWIIKFT